MEARIFRAAFAVALLAVSMGARARTPNFIIDTPDPAHARQFAARAEKLRRELSVAWLGREMPNWSQPCTITVRVGPGLGAGGATSFVFNDGEVFGWRMTIQGSHRRVLDSVLPHEITHMVFASHFRQPLPRWCDEGGATSVECSEERMRHRKMLVQFLRTGRGIALNRMFAMKNYPPDVMPLYAQGFSLAEYLIQKGGRRKYVAFMGDGLRGNDWSGAIRRNYGIPGAAALQNTWLAWVRNGWPSLKQAPPAPAVKPRPEMLAAGRKLPRPRPNLIYHIPNEPRKNYAPGSTVAATSLASATVRPVAKTLPASGWHAPGARPAVVPAVAAAAPKQPRPLQSQVTRPQQFQQPGQQPVQWHRR